MKPEPSAAVRAETSVDDVMSADARTIPAFLRRRMMCPGCPVGRIHTVEDACVEHGVPLEDFLFELNAIVAGSPGPDPGWDPMVRLDPLQDDGASPERAEPAPQQT